MHTARVVAFVVVALVACSSGSAPRTDAARSGASARPSDSSSNSGSSADEADDAPGEPPQTTPTTLTYCAPDGRPQLMDLYLPADTSSPVPVALYVHGGGWKSGDRSHGGFLDQMVAGLTARGVAVAAVDYRLVPTVVFPAPIEDVKCAVRFLRAKAADLHIDPAHIGAWGGSAGGHLVSLLATTDASAGYDAGEYADQSSRIQAVVDMFGLADASLALPNGCMPHSAVCNILGADATSTDLPDRIRAFSPVTYITADDPPFLILQGDHDHTVPQEQSQLLSQRLQAAGVDQQLVIVRGGNHGLGQTREVPPPDQLVQMTIDFLVKRLKG